VKDEDRSRPDPTMREEAIIPFSGPPELTPPVTEVRGTLLSSSLQMLRDRGLRDRYLRALPARYHDAIESLVAGTWLPIEVAHAHYVAVDSLGLSDADILQIGRSVGDRIQNGHLGTILRGARNLGGIDPWSIISRVDVLRQRVFRGGEAAAFKLGPKDARIEFVGISLAQVRYFRVGMQGIIESALSLSARKVYVRTTHGAWGPDSMAYTVSFV
jgi:hypothetical protein